MEEKCNQGLHYKCDKISGAKKRRLEIKQRQKLGVIKAVVGIIISRSVRDKN